MRLGIALVACLHDFQFRRVITTLGSVIVSNVVAQTVGIVMNDHGPSNTPFALFPSLVAPLLAEPHVWLGGSHLRASRDRRVFELRDHNKLLFFHYASQKRAVETFHDVSII